MAHKLVVGCKIQYGYIIYGSNICLFWDPYRT